MINIFFLCMQYDKYSTGPDSCLIDKLKVLSTSIVTGITKLFRQILCSNYIAIFGKEVEGNYRVLNT